MENQLKKLAKWVKIGSVILLEQTKARKMSVWLMHMLAILSGTVRLTVDYVLQKATVRVEYKTESVLTSR